MSLTPLHLALGVLEDVELSLDLVRQACDSSVRERDDLDWKSALPLTAPPGQETGRDVQQEELAKDIAAMANSRGGLIVYGVAEKAATSAASHIKTVGPPDEVTQQNIRRVASNQIYPPVTALTMQWLTASDSNDVVLALVVAPSVESPHLVRPRRQPAGTGFWFAVPFRNGPDTDWMPEKLIESAYRDRLANRRQRDEDLRQLQNDLATFVANTVGGGAWIVAVARPDNPRPPRPRPDPATVAQVFDRAWQTSPAQVHLSAFSAAAMLLSEPKRRGLRRISQIGSRTVRALGGNTPTVRMVAEVHFDGSVGLAFTRAGAFGSNDQADGRFLATVDLDQVALDLYTLVEQTARDLHVHGDYEARLSVEPASEVALFRRPDPILGKEFLQFSADDRIGQFHPVTGPLVVSQRAELRTMLTKSPPLRILRR